jgi:predicted dehydrogenase
MCHFVRQAKGYNMYKKAKLAVIGCGGLAQSQYLPNLFKIDNAELVVICDMFQENLDKVGDYYGIERRELDYRKVLANPEIDGVLIVTREDSHVALTLEALAAGKHVYVEKPLAETANECAKVFEAQKKAGKIVAIGMNRRMAPAYQYAKKLLSNKGGAKNMFYRIADSYSLDWGKAFGEGQRIIHEVCHIFDILRFFADSEVKSVYCVASRPDDETIVLQFESGAVATVMSSGYVNSDMPKERFEAIAETGSLIIEDFAEVTQYSLDENKPDTKTFAGHSHPMHDQIHEYLVEELGAEGMKAVRRVSWRVLEKIEKLEEENNTDTAEYRKLKDFSEKMPLRNYFINKGWRDAIEDFAEAILTNRDFAGAKVNDGFQAAKITEAAIKSRATATIINL